MAGVFHGEEGETPGSDDIGDGLALRRLGKIYCYDEVDSTNRVARELARRGAPDGTVIIAETQTRGRGRMGRVWVSPSHVNLYISFLLRPELHPTRAGQLTLTAAVAVAETIAGYLPFPPTIKWPNDILLRGRKTAGILSELACEPNRTLFAVIGVGVNLNFPESGMPAELRSVATSLMTTLGRPVNRLEFTRNLLKQMDHWYAALTEGHFGQIVSRWRGYARLEGRRIRVTQLHETFTAQARELDADGALIVQKDDGTQERIVAGDVAFIGEG